MLKLVLAAVALVSSWFWMRAMFSRVIDGREKLTARAFALRGTALAASTIWFLAAVFGVMGGLFGWLVLAAVVGLVVKLLGEGLVLGRAEQAARASEPPQGGDG